MKDPRWAALTLVEAEKSSDPFTDLQRDLVLNVVVVVTNVLTVCGSALILVSYLCFPHLRTEVRLILFHLSLMDLVVGLSHSVGGVTMYVGYRNASQTLMTFCRAQAFVGYFAIISSVLWTVCLSTCLFLLSQWSASGIKLGVMRLHFWLSCAGCYGIPLVLSLWLLLTDRFGYSPYDAAGWCTIVTRTQFRDDVFASVFGYDLWIYLAMFLITVLYLSSHVRRRLHQQRGDKLSTVDYKFIFVPLVFIFLRMWSCILDILYYYHWDKQEDIPHQAGIILTFLAGIGDSAQGFTNAILFVCFTKPARDAFRKWFPCHKGREKPFVNVH